MLAECNGQGSLAQYGTTITTPQLEKQKDGAVDTVVKSRIVNQDDQAHSIYAEYEIVDQNGRSGRRKKRAVKHKLFYEVRDQLSQTLMLKTNPLGCENGSSSSLYICAGLSGLRLVDVQKGSFGYHFNI